MKRIKCTPKTRGKFSSIMFTVILIVVKKIINKQKQTKKHKKTLINSRVLCWWGYSHDGK